MGFLKVYKGHLSFFHMEENEKTNLIRKISNYLIFGSGLCAIIDGTVRITDNPPEYLFNWNNLDNCQYQFGVALTIFGGATVAYGVERIVKYCKE